ncbi:MAG: NAD-dependent epimerase/dehydratase family protein [Oligoflexales bacterium]
MKVLIIGGTQFIGKAVAKRASERGHEIVLFNRGLSQSDASFPTIIGDVNDLPQYQTQLRQVRADAVVHAIAYTERHALDAVEVFQDTGARIVALSSVDCYEAFYQLNKGRDVGDFPITEESPTCHRRHYWRDFPGIKKYPDYDKNLMSSAFMSAHAEGKITATILRLPMVFGPGDSQYQHRHGKFIRRVFDRQKTLLMGANEQSSLFTFGFIDNVAAAILHAAESQAATGKIFNVGESKSRSLRRWAELYGEAANINLDVTVLPDAIIENDPTIAHSSPRFFLSDSGYFRRETGFTEPVELADQIRQTLAWGLEHPESLGPQPDYDKENALIGLYRRFLSQPLPQ